MMKTLTCSFIREAVTASFSRLRKELHCFSNSFPPACMEYK